MKFAEKYHTESDLADLKAGDVVRVVGIPGIPNNDHRRVEEGTTGLLYLHYNVEHVGQDHPNLNNYPVVPLGRVGTLNIGLSSFLERVPPPS